MPGWQERTARTVGAYLGGELNTLAARFPEIGAVYGEGLYRGVDIVVPGGDKEPAPAAATQMCERMLELGVVIQPTGVELNVRHERWASVEATAVVGIVRRR
ncbi:hypothetical protein [Streptomyces europaeiscabiei]|uniref:hypothetical protein n=1 Tax=Streptomyces europaeiscabiei TaxID=146819 RepID=UPI0029AF5F4F|nr:hypothetical protein [Streptomyces europaeiscabiei]MDX3614916.1 hypothetical protein [Streptomyces europaeiscabiei]